MTARHRTIRLLEHLEDRRPLLFRNAGSRVADREVQNYVVRGTRLLAHLHTDLTLVGELDGITDQVGHDLAQAAVVAGHHLRHFGMDEAGQLETSLVRPDGERFHRVAETFPQVERTMVEDQLVGFDLREVEDVVDYREQGFARVLAITRSQVSAESAAENSSGVSTRRHATSYPPRRNSRSNSTASSSVSSTSSSRNGVAITALRESGGIR
jgi:hypothetical protein